MPKLPLNTKSIVSNKLKGTVDIVLGLTKVETSINTPWPIMFMDIKWILNGVYFAFRCLSDLFSPNSARLVGERSVPLPWRTAALCEREELAAARDKETVRRRPWGTNDFLIRATWKLDRASGPTRASDRTSGSSGSDKKKDRNFDLFNIRYECGFKTSIANWLKKLILPIRQHN